MGRFYVVFDERFTLNLNQVAKNMRAPAGSAMKSRDVEFGCVQNLVPAAQKLSC